MEIVDRNATAPSPGALIGVNPCPFVVKIELSPAPFRGKLCAPMQQVNLGMIGGGTVGR
jgi:hypothetical protein